MGNVATATVEVHFFSPPSRNVLGRGFCPNILNLVMDRVLFYIYKDCWGTEMVMLCVRDVLIMKTIASFEYLNCYRFNVKGLQKVVQVTSQHLRRAMHIFHENLKYIKYMVLGKGKLRTVICITNQKFTYTLE